MQSLKQLYEERRSSQEFRERDAEYEQFDRVYRSKKIRGTGDPTYRPNLLDNLPSQELEQDTHEIVVNQVRRVVSHFTAIFAYPPRTTIRPLLTKEGESFLAGTQDLSDLDAHLKNRSGLDTLHPRNSFWLSLRGDCVFGLDWGLLRGWTSPMGQLRRGLRYFVFDPKFCYPLLSEFDPGGVEDMLVCLQLQPDTAKEMFELSAEQTDSVRELCRVFYYWTRNEFRVAVEDHELDTFHVKHDLGFCPFRWVHGDPSGKFAQADVREVPKMQEIFNEGLLLAITAVARQVDQSWWVAMEGTGKETLEPEPGKANVLPPGANVGKWEIAVDPQIILGVMDYLEHAIQSTTGVSPISMTGQVSASGQRSGAAIRHQVEAAEARTETRKAILQNAYARLSEMSMYILKTKFPEETIHFQAGDELRQLSSDKIAQYVEAEAQYGGFLGIPIERRVQVAMQGLGHLWDDEYAVGDIVDISSVTPRAMRDRIREYHVEQARIQAEAQQIAQQGQPGQDQGQPGQQAPQGTARRQPIPPPNMGQLNEYLQKYSGGSNGRH